MSKVFNGVRKFTRDTKYKSLELKSANGYVYGYNVANLRSVNEIRELATTLLVLDVTLIFDTVDDRQEYLEHVDRILRAYTSEFNEARRKDVVNIIASSEYLCLYNVLGNGRVC